MTQKDNLQKSFIRTFTCKKVVWNDDLQKKLSGTTTNLQNIGLNDSLKKNQCGTTISKKGVQNAYLQNKCQKNNLFGMAICKNDHEEQQFAKQLSGTISFKICKILKKNAKTLFGRPACKKKKEVTICKIVVCNNQMQKNLKWEFANVEKNIWNDN